jgi:hypothetical protein
MNKTIDSSNKWQVYSEISEAMSKEHTLEELSAWLADIASEVNQWAIRNVAKNTGYKKNDMLLYIQYLSKLTVLLMAVHCKIKETDPELYDIIEHNVMHEFCEQYCSD